MTTEQFQNWIKKATINIGDVYSDGFDVCLEIKINNLDFEVCADIFDIRDWLDSEHPMEKVKGPEVIYPFSWHAERDDFVISEGIEEHKQEFMLNFIENLEIRIV